MESNSKSTDILSDVANEILDAGLTEALGPDQVDLSARAVAQLRDVVENNTIKQLIGRLRALILAVDEYRNAPDATKLSNLRRDARILSSELAEYTSHRSVYIHYQTAKSIYIGAIERTYEVDKVEGEKINIAHAGHDAVQQMLAIEKAESERLSNYSFACFKQYTLEGGDARAVYRSLPAAVRAHDADLLALMGHHYHGVIHGYLARIAGHDELLRKVPRAKYVCKMFENQSLAYDGDWVGARRGRFYRCHARDDYFPTGDAFATDGAKVSTLYVKPLRESPVTSDSWKRIWDDRSAGREDSYPHERRPIAFWRAEVAGRESFGSMIESLTGDGKRPAGTPRILLLPIEDLEGAVRSGGRWSRDWDDEGSGADDDVWVRRIESFTAHDQGDTTDDLLDERGGLFQAVPFETSWSNRHCLRHETLLGY